MESFFYNSSIQPSLSPLLYLPKKPKKDHINNKKKVDFKIFNDVYYVNYDPDYNNWLSNNDFINSKISAHTEVKNLLLENPGMTVRDALKLLYQPENILYYEKNLE
jgi:hypothetical protein